MMTAALVLALGACGEHTGWNPNYSLGDRPYAERLDRDTPYTRYLLRREATLQGDAPLPRVIPIARPFKAPTAADIAAEDLWQLDPRDARVATATTVVVTAPPAVAAAPVTTQGPYPGSTPVLARYAASVDHAPGTAVSRRTAPDPNRALQVCRSYASPDAAQIAFLARGGPGLDPQRMDPDGDGFVCGWDPASWRPPLR